MQSARVVAAVDELGSFCVACVRHRHVNGMKPALARLPCAIAVAMSLSLAFGIGIWFFAYRLTTRMSMETWARYAGGLQARVWFEEEHYRLLELSSSEKMEFTGRTNGPFEIWTWTHYTNNPSLTVQTADQKFVDAFNRRMRQLWENRQREAELGGATNGSKPIRSETNRTSSAAGSRR